MSLTSDPEVEVVDTDEWLWAWIKNFEAVEVAGRRVHLGNQHVPTAHAAVLVNGSSRREPWNSYLAIHRSGALECGLGDRGAWERKDRDGNVVRVFNLISIVGCTWAMLKFGAALRERVAPAGPFQLTIALQRTEGAYLGNVGDGWAEPLDWNNDLPPCPDAHLLLAHRARRLARRRCRPAHRLSSRRPTSKTRGVPAVDGTWLASGSMRVVSTPVSSEAEGRGGGRCNGELALLDFQ